MRNSTDPSLHRQRERQFIDHVEKLLNDDRLRLETTRGRKSITFAMRKVTRSNHGSDLKRLMSELGKRDRDLQDRMPIAESLDVELSQKRLWILKNIVGRLHVQSVPPTRPLLDGQPPAPLTKTDLLKSLGQIPPPVRLEPLTAILFSSSGFTPDARDLARLAPDRKLILVEPNDAGGFNVYGPPNYRDLAEILDPEAEQAKRDRITQAVVARNSDLTGAGIAADRLAAQTELPVQLVEAELKSYAQNHAGLAARKLDGRLVLFREGTMAPENLAGGSSMPMIDRIRSLFARKGENEKKIAFLSERRTALSQQRDRAYEEVSSLEAKDNELRQQFKTSSNELAKRRITSQLLQFRKDMERRQQLLGVLNQQINVVSTHLHNLELVQQGATAQLPDSDEMATDAAKAEEVLAELEANTELAASIGSIGSTSLSAEEQALYDQLQQESAPTQTAAQTVADPASSATRAAPVSKSAAPPIPPQSQRQPRPSEPEPG